ncbi:MAG: ABC transporter ATP-binding protein [Bacillota bacterium]
MDLLKIINLRVHFESADGMVKAVDGVDLSVGLGETVGLLGETGSGKTVLGLAVIGLLPRNVRMRGEVWYRGKNLMSLTEKEMRGVRGREIAMIMQNPLSSLNPSLSVGEQIAEAIREHQGVNKKEAWARAKEVLNQTGIPSNRAGNYPHQFSGGMRQRAIIAIGLACQPSFLIADEPTKGLDLTVQTQIVELIGSLTRNFTPPRSMLLITHDLGVAAELADSIAVMYAGKIVEFGSVRDVFKSPVHPYTRGFLASHPGNGLRAIDGNGPSLIDPPSGCSFHPRCKKALALCRLEEPLIKTVGENHGARCHYA